MRPTTLKTWPFLLVFALATPFANAIEKLSTNDLVALCKNFDKQQVSADNRECTRYIKGVVDGLILSEKFNSELNNGNKPTQSNFEARLVNTRIMSRLERNYRAPDNQICIDDVGELPTIVDTVANSVSDQSDNHKYARYVVYNSLLTHFKCSS